VDVQLGQAQVLALVKGEIMQPYPDQRNEGSMSIFTEFSSMGNPAFEPGRPSDMVVELGRIIDYGLR
jgi:exosome complex component RRP45